MDAPVSVVKRLLGTELIDEVAIDKLSRDRLLRCFCNCLYLGHWHLAVSCLDVHKSLKSESVSDEHNFEAILKGFVENPYCGRCVKFHVVIFIVLKENLLCPDRPGQCLVGRRA